MEHRVIAYYNYLLWTVDNPAWHLVLPHSWSQKRLGPTMGPCGQAINARRSTLD